MGDAPITPVAQVIDVSRKLIPDVGNNMKNKMPVIIIGSLTFIAGLAWNNAFNALIDNYIPKEYRDRNNAWFKVLYAFILTTIIIVIISLIVKFTPD